MREGGRAMGAGAWWRLVVALGLVVAAGINQGCGGAGHHQPGKEDAAAQAGTAHVTTSVDCALIVSVLAAPTVTSVGGKVSLRAEVTPSDASPTVYSWTTSSGTIVAPTAAETTFVCVQEGATKVVLSTSRGACRDDAEVGIKCVKASP